MTSRYSLRNRTGGVTPAANGESNSPPSQNTNTLDPQPVAAAMPRAASPRSYSDVVASRPGSPASMQGSMSAMSSNVSGGRISPQTDLADTSLGAVAVAGLDLEDDGNGPWQVVRPRRVRSTGSLGGRRNIQYNGTVPIRVVTGTGTAGVVSPAARNTLPLDQEITFALARANLTREQAQQIDNRRRATVEDASDTSSVTVEPTTLQKGKGPDPRNWGGIASLLNEDIDVDRQRMALDAYARAKIAQIHINEPSNSRVEDRGSLTEGGSPPVNIATKGMN
ncbi:hypothetical protein H0H87_006890, partial [Tephrocybe sp. NHM501043]